jgi:hypothetical protein
MSEEPEISAELISAENRANRRERLYESALEEIELLRGQVLHLLYCPKQACSYCTQLEREYRNERA